MCTVLDGTLEVTAYIRRTWLAGGVLYQANGKGTQFSLPGKGLALGFINIFLRCAATLSAAG